MRLDKLVLAGLLTAAAIPLALSASLPATRVIRVVDTVFVKSAPPPIDYDELSRHVALRLAQNAAKPTVIEGDLIVKGRLGIGGEPEAGTGYAITVRGPNDAALRFISNEKMADPQRAANQHRHVGTLGLGQDGGLRLDQNSTCFSDDRGCSADDRQRRHAYTGFDSLGDISFFLSDVDSTSGRDASPRAQNIVLRLIDWDNNIHINAFRPGQRIFFNGSKTLNAADLQWEVPLSPVPAIR